MRTGAAAAMVGQAPPVGLIEESVFEVLAKRQLDDGFDASPALMGNGMFMRGYKHLYALAAP